MPLYTFTCPQCHTDVDFMLKIADRESKEGAACENCGGAITRKITPVAFGSNISLGTTGQNGAMREVLQKIHSRVPGSQLDKASSINKI